MRKTTRSPHKPQGALRRIEHLAHAHAPDGRTTWARCSPTAAPTSTARGTPSGCAITTSTARSAGKASTRTSSISGVYFRQRDHYDEANLEGEDDDGRAVGRRACSPGRALQVLLQSRLALQHLQRRRGAAAGPAQLLRRRRHDRHLARLRRVSPPRPLPELRRRRSLRSRGRSVAADRRDRYEGEEELSP